jgi:hypothetical protein
MDFEDRLAAARLAFERGETLDEITHARVVQANHRAIQALLSNLVPGAPPPNPAARLRLA